jgi:TetR/AcrR family transcriptional regulator
MVFAEKESDSRLKILDSAIEEFSHYGLAGARVDRIASRAKVNKAMIYYHFQSKENLYCSVIDTFVGQMSSKLAGQIAAGIDLEQALLEISQSYHSLLLTDKRLTALFVHEIASGGERLKEALMKFVSGRGIPGIVRRMIEEGKAGRRYRDIDPRQVVLAFIGMNVFYLVMAPIANSIWEIEDEQEFCRKRPAALVDLFLHGIEQNH